MGALSNHTQQRLFHCYGDESFGGARQSLLDAYFAWQAEPKNKARLHALNEAKQALRDEMEQGSYGTRQRPIACADSQNFLIRYYIDTEIAHRKEQSPDSRPVAPSDTPVTHELVVRPATRAIIIDRTAPPTTIGQPPRRHQKQPPQQDNDNPTAILSDWVNRSYCPPSSSAPSRT